MSSRTVLAVSELMRAVGADHLRQLGATPADGVPTSLPDGIHVAAISEAELATARQLPPGTRHVLLRDLVAPDRLPLFQTQDLMVALHRCDVSVPNGFVPIDVGTFNFGSAIHVRGGFAIGHVIVWDSRGQAGEPYDLDVVPVFDTVGNAWTAHRHRGQGVAAGLLAHVRAVYPITELQRPFTPAGAAWARACAPDLLDVGRNSLCPCGSQLKFKRCHGVRRAA